MPAVIGLLLAASVAAAPSDAARPRLYVQMEVDAGMSLDTADLRAIAVHAERIWAPVFDVEIGLPSRLQRPIAVDSIRLRVTNRMLPTREHTGLGWIEFVNDEPRPEITVSLAAVRALLAGGVWHGRPFNTLPARASREFVQRALGRAVAHEVGHYLLKSRTHDRSGLMRAVFSVDEIMDARHALDRLDPSQLSRLRDGGGLKAETVPERLADQPR